MNIFLTNDDGFNKPGLLALAEAAEKRGHHGVIVAPHVQQSAKSHSFTLSRPLFVHKQPAACPGFPVFSVEGTPADCVRVGLQKLMPEPADFVISGMNCGWNLGTAVYYSATFSAAREGAFHYLPSIAVSAHEDSTAAMLAYFAEMTIQIAEAYASRPLQRNSVLNINYPLRSPEECLEMLQVPLDTAFFSDGYIAFETPRGESCYFMEKGDQTEPNDPGSDVCFVKQGHPVFTLIGGVQSIDNPLSFHLTEK